MFLHDKSLPRDGGNQWLIVPTNMKLDDWFGVLVNTSSSVAVIVNIPGKRLAYHVLDRE
jgi:hypothetical protein